MNENDLIQYELNETRATGNSRFESRKSPPLRAKIPENSRYLIPPYTHFLLTQI